MRIRDWSSDVCSSDLLGAARAPAAAVPAAVRRQDDAGRRAALRTAVRRRRAAAAALAAGLGVACERAGGDAGVLAVRQPHPAGPGVGGAWVRYLTGAPRKRRRAVAGASRPARGSPR